MTANKIKQQLENVVPDILENVNSALFKEKKPLRRKLPEPDQFPIDALGDLLSGVALKMAGIIKAPPAICGQSILAAATLATQGFANVNIDGRIIPISCFFLTVGKTGERKSAVDYIALKPHYNYQLQLREKYLIDTEIWEKEYAAYEAAKKEAISRKNKTLRDKSFALEILGKPPTKPIGPLIIAEEPTYEGLVKMLEIGQPSIGLFSDEGGRFIGGHGMNNDNILKTAAGLSGMWDGRSINRIRVGDGATMLVGKRVSAHLMVQPEIAQMILSNSLLSDQGLLSRCLISFPNSTAGTRQYSEENLTMQNEFIRYEQRIESILNSFKRLIPNKLNELDPKSLFVSQDAKKLWIEFYNDIEEQIGDEGAFSSIRGLANKAAEHALRISAVLTLVNNLDSEFIDTKEMHSAIKLVLYYLSEALRLFDVAYANPRLLIAEKLLQWLRNKKYTTVTLVEIYQYSINSIREAQVARDIMNILVDHGYALVLANGAEFNGKHREEAWELRL